MNLCTISELESDSFVLKVAGGSAKVNVCKANRANKVKILFACVNSN